MGEDKIFMGANKGTHDMNGILIINGPNITIGGKIAEANIVDIVPTIYQIFNIPPPQEMDGVIPDNIFEN